MNFTLFSLLNLTDYCIFFFCQKTGGNILVSHFLHWQQVLLWLFIFGWSVCNIYYFLNNCLCFKGRCNYGILISMWYFLLLWIVSEELFDNFKPPVSMVKLKLFPIKYKPFCPLFFFVKLYVLDHNPHTFSCKKGK